jgi:peptidoglycan/LPS O-acetylase OafA/YrhL
MNFTNHTLEWYKGEAFESILTAGFGILLLIFAILVWILGTTPGAKAMVIPLIVIGCIIAGPGISNTLSIRKSITHYEQFEPDDENAFVISEKSRVERFDSLYTFTKFLALGLFAMAILIFFFLKNQHALASGIAMIILGLSGLVIDYFSQERADVYYQEILKYLE